MLPDTLMQHFSQCVSARTGMQVGPSRHADLLRAITGLVPGHSDAKRQAALLDWLACTPPQVQAEAMARQLAVGETYFFREPAAFEALEHEVLPALIAERRRKGRRLRLWSAGCCTGEEAYSLAIVLARAVPDLAEWDASILATDIHPGFLERAQQGVYGAWSFRGVPHRQRIGAFDVSDDGQRHAVRPALKRLIRFRCANLVEAPPEGGPFDVVLCRHVLMYFEGEQARQTVQRLHGALASDGWLLVGPVEGSCGLHDGFEERHIGGATFHCKRATTPQAPAKLPAVSVPAERSRTDRRVAVDALSACEATLAADKCNPALHYVHALLLEQADDVPGARRALRRALFLDPRFVLGHVTLARLCHREGRGEQARRHIDHAMNAMNAMNAVGGRSA